MPLASVLVALAITASVGALLVVVAQVWASTDDAGGAAPDGAAPARPTGQASFRPLFVHRTAETFVVDGLLTRAGGDIGYPATIELGSPRDARIATLLVLCLERWADEGVSMTFDLRERADRPPVVAMSTSQSFLRLPLVHLTAEA